MGKISKTMRFDDELWKRAQSAAKQVRQSATAYIETATEEKIKKDQKEGKIVIK